MFRVRGGLYQWQPHNGGGLSVSSFTNPETLNLEHSAWLPSGGV